MSACHGTLLFRGGDVIDGSGAVAVGADVAVIGDRIAAVGALDGWTADTVVDAGGLTLCPGFIDSHAHDDQYVFDDPQVLPKTSQGVTSVVTGNCGISLAPLVAERPVPGPLTELAPTAAYRFATFAAYLDAVASSPPAVNVASLVGHTTLRVAAMAELDRPATDRERAKMRAMAEDAMRAGAIGVSSGLYYPPARAAPEDEVTELATIAAAYGGVYTAHLRDEGDAVIEAIDEAVRIARTSGAPLVISHHKVMGRANFGRTAETLSRIEAACECHPVGIDVYPYIAGASSLLHEPHVAAERVIVTWSTPHPELAGQDLAAIALHLGMSESAAIDALSPGGAIYFVMEEPDVRRVLCWPHTAIGSDGTPANGRPHPRMWGTFTRVLGHYARDAGLMPFEEAVRRMTSLPAGRFGLAGRGMLSAGNFADLVLLDRARVRDRADFANPVRASEGIAGVFVNGVKVYDRDGASGATPGRVLPGSKTRRS